MEENKLLLLLFGPEIMSSSAHTMRKYSIMPSKG